MAKRYRRALEDFADWYQGTYGKDREPELLTEVEGREWRAQLVGVRKYAASTVNLRLSALWGIVRHAGGRLDVSGVDQLDPPIEALNGRQLGRLIRVVEQHRWGPDWLWKRNAAMVVALMARAGLRVSEVVGLDLKDLEIRERSGWATIREGKGLKARQVPLSLHVRKALSRYLEARPDTAAGAVFVSDNGSGLSARSIQRMVKGAAQRAGIDQDVTPHLLRHTFASRFLRKGGDLATLRDILGHANVDTTSRYVHSDAARMQQMCRCCEDRLWLGHPVR